MRSIRADSRKNTRTHPAANEGKQGENDPPRWFAASLPDNRLARTLTEIKRKLRVCTST